MRRVYHSPPATPVSPDAATAVTPDVNLLIITINTFLSEPWSDAERGGGRTHHVEDMTVPQRDAILRVFRSTGWKVDLVPDQRDGDYLRFRP